MRKALHGHRNSLNLHTSFFADFALQTMQDGGVCVFDFTTWDFEDVGENRFVGGAFEEEFGGGWKLGGRLWRRRSVYCSTGRILKGES